ncbi:DUF4232 domain-containing protein [Saccharopolyspora sp. HNM0983]|uniref:DUF4232 domain-containing protein n=1 Tax=Saccharopolyspora montiporae TaxID=2781240 RepID=A0A929FYT7_9PSEU|nr:DUF4232 domain-containing protein [Saccharopolyspora sp. HNM0983]MBE9373820.1 DUF4232 domain-containing protein [Saccharopolyspora sp. HNM0983]
MANAPSKRTTLTAGLTAMAVSGLGMATMATAQATPPPPPPACTAGDVSVSTAERPSPSEQERRYEIVVDAQPGAVCELSGTPEELAFHGPGGPLPMPVETEPASGERITLSGNHSAAALLTGPATEGPARATSVSLTLPGDDTPIRTGWVRGGVDGPLRAGSFTAGG